MGNEGLIGPLNFLLQEIVGKIRNGLSLSLSAIRIVMTEPIQGNQPDATVEQHETSAASAATSASASTDAAADASTGDKSPAELQREVAELKDRHLRLAAEYDNFRRRAVKERQEASWRGQGDLVRGMLDAIDDITRFAHVDPASVDAKTVVDGVLMVEKKLFKTLAGHGFETIDPTGHPFDPSQHEAVTTAPAESAEQDGVVADRKSVV